MIGKSLGHYEISAMLGKGGMGEVYLARDTKLDRDVAIKVLPQQMSGDPERVARFRREARTLATLQHANVASIYGFEDTNEARFLVMEYVEGLDLEARLEQGALPLDEAVEVAQQIACGLEVAHEQGIVHRDLKPANVKLTPDGQVKVLDFGLARAFLGEESDESDPANSPTITAAMTQAGMILGTASYMSPEQARGKRVDRRADIWAFGVILFELLSGRRLFAGETVSETLAGVLKGDIDLSMLPKSCPPSLRRLVERCLDRDPHTRLRDIGEARVALSRPMETEAMASSAGGRRVLALVGVAVVALVLGAVVTKVLAPGGGTPTPAASIQFEISRNTPNVARSAISPDGTRLLYVSDGKLWVRSFGSLRPREVSGSEGAVACEWSPDGTWIVYASPTVIYKSRPDGSDRARICQVPTDLHEFAGSVDWTQDGRIVFAPGDMGLMSVSASGGDPKVLLAPSPEETDFHHISVLPEDRGFLFHPHADLVFDSIHVFDGEQRHEVLRVEGTTLNSADYAAGHIVFTRSFDNPGVWAVPFSIEELHVTGDPFLVIPDGTFPSVSRAGDLAYVPESRLTGQIIQLDDRGRAIAEISEPIVGIRHLRTSEDGREVLAVIEGENDELWIFDLQSTDRRRVTFARSGIGAASWSSDGDRIIYTGGGRSSALHQQIVDRNGIRGDAIPVRGRYPIFSHDGRYLVLSAWDEANDPDIVCIDLQNPDAAPEPIADTRFSEEHPALSPDDQLVAYTSLESGRSEVIVKRFPTGDQRWQVSVDGGTQPFWSRSGDRLYYGSASSGWLMAVDVLRDPVRFSAPRQHIDTSALREVVAGPEGTFLALRMSAGAGQGSYAVWLGWRDSLGK